MKGNPRCPDCHGAGGRMLAGTWRSCDCVRMDSTRRAAQRQASIDDAAAFRRVQERLAQRERGK